HGHQVAHRRGLHAARARGEEPRVAFEVASRRGPARHGPEFVVYRHPPSAAYRSGTVEISLFMDIGQGAGLSGSSGVRPFLPSLLAVALARENSGVDFSGTDFSFLESPAFLLVVFVLALGSYALGRRRQNVPEAVLLALGVVLGALL